MGPQLILPLASVTDFIVDPIVEFSIDFIDSVGAVGVFLLMILESACIPVPSEAIMLFAGFGVSEGDLTMITIVVAGVAGNLVGSWLTWGIGYYGRTELLEKSRFVHVNPRHLAWADSWFERHGAATVFFARMVPIVRTFISLPAGIARMPLGRFTLLTILGCIPWVLGLALIGEAVGDNWDELRGKLHYLDYPIAAAIVLGIAYFVIKRRRSGPPGPPTRSEA